MQVTVEDHGSCRRILHIEIPADHVDKVYNEVIGQFQAHAVVPGFRKGRAPRNMVQAKFKQDILEQLEEKLVPMGYRNAIKQEKLDVVSIHNVDKPEVLMGAPFTYSVTVEVAPEIELPTYKGIPLQRPPKIVDEDFIDDQLHQMQREAAQFSDSDGPVESGDMVQIDYTGLLDDKPLTELDLELTNGMLAGQEGFWTRADEKAFLPELGTTLVGLDIGDEGQTEIEFPEDATEKALAGKEVAYTFSVLAIRHPELPELNDEFAQTMQQDSMEALRDDIRNRFADQETEVVRGALRNQLMEKLMAAVEFELPESAVNTETRNRIYDLVTRYKEQGVEESEIDEKKNEIFEHANQQARGRLRVQYVMKQIARAEGIEVTPDEVTNYIQMIAENVKKPEKEVRAIMEENGKLDEFRIDSLVDKTLDFLMEEADISE